ncbi:ABC transporter ATP-binding protein [bacterium]|nr:ABC transporter ATP-binding protein [bacterium]MCI0566278.1 ABC transporter ATP-binding protein [bacterium]MCI0679967.1 ABC transporter ATP-binding protein [bacterium]
MIETKKLVKSFRDGEVFTEVLRGIDFRLESGEYAAIMGRSGAGKSTFLYQISLLDQPTSGEILINGRNTEKMTESEQTRYRLAHFGYVFQDYALLPELSATENVMLPLLMRGLTGKSARAQAEQSLARLGLKKRLHNIPSHLSGGEQQRVSIARAIAHHPKILFADEPTANLDSESSNTIMDIFAELHKEKQTIIMITHELEYAKRAERIITIDDGKIISDKRNSSK